MAENDDLVEVDLTEDAADAAAAEKAAKKAKKKTDDVVIEADGAKKSAVAAPTADEVVAKLKKDLDTEKNARAAAEQKAKEEARRADSSLKEVGTTQLQLVTNAISTLKADSERLESDYEVAFAAGDGKALAKIQRAMADGAARLLQLENGKTAMEEEAKRFKDTPETSTIVDPVEALASQLTAPSAEWVRKHPEYARNPRLNRKMIRAHEDAMDEGVEPDSEAYFEFIEKTVGIRKGDDADAGSAMSEAAAPAQRRASSAAAPVSHSGTASGARPGRVTLTKEEAEIAEMNGMTNKEYYEQKMKIQSSRMN